MTATACRIVDYGKGKNALLLIKLCLMPRKTYVGEWRYSSTLS